MSWTPPRKVSRDDAIEAFGYPWRLRDEEARAAAIDAYQRVADLARDTPPDARITYRRTKGYWTRRLKCLFHR